jgi:hypothetical protein
VNTINHYVIKLSVTEKNMVFVDPIGIFLHVANFWPHISLIYRNLTGGKTHVCHPVIFLSPDMVKHYVIKLSVTCDRSVVFPGYSGFLHQQN